jgi:hypothetical protein
LMIILVLIDHFGAGYSMSIRPGLTWPDLLFQEIRIWIVFCRD